jgi:hypothetical protein
MHPEADQEIGVLVFVIAVRLQSGVFLSVCAAGGFKLSAGGVYEYVMTFVDI